MKCASGFKKAVQKPAKCSSVSNVARPSRNVAPKKLASFSPLDMSSASRETQPFEENINLPSCSIFLKTQKYFLAVNDNQVSTVFCVINSRKPAFGPSVDTKDRDFSLSYCFFVAWRWSFSEQKSERLVVDSSFSVCLCILAAPRARPALLDPGSGPGPFA